MSTELNRIENELETITAGFAAKKRKLNERATEIRKQLSEIASANDAALASGEQERYYDAGFKREQLTKELHQVEDELNSVRNTHISEEQFNDYFARLNEAAAAKDRKMASLFVKEWEKLEQAAHEYTDETRRINEIHRAAKRAAGMDTSNSYDIIAFDSLIRTAVNAVSPYLREIRNMAGAASED